MGIEAWPLTQQVPFIPRTPKSFLELRETFASVIAGAPDFQHPFFVGYSIDGAFKEVLSGIDFLHEQIAKDGQGHLLSEGTSLVHSSHNSFKCGDIKGGFKAIHAADRVFQEIGRLAKQR